MSIKFSLPFEPLSEESERQRLDEESLKQQIEEYKAEAEAQMRAEYEDQIIREEEAAREAAE